MSTSQDLTQQDPEPEFSLLRSFKLGSFYIGSSLTDLLTSAVWNRILIVDLGVAAWPVTLLSALRYLMSPLTLWIGHLSDTHPIAGSRRIAYIWLGRLLMLVSLPLLPLSMAAIGFDTHAQTGWAMALFSFTLYGFGTLMSGAPYLALVHDSAPYQRRGQVIAIVQTFLVASFAFGGFLYGRILPVWDYQRFWFLVVFAMLGAAFFWFFSVWGEERRLPRVVATNSSPSFRETFSNILQDKRLVRYGIFLGASAFFAFMQDAMLEPFGGDVFLMDVGETTRFNAFWGSGVLISMIATAYFTRHWRPDQQVSTTAWGLMLLATPLALLGLASAMKLQLFLEPILVAFGIGFGIFTVGGVALLMAMNKDGEAASYLALWSMIQLVSRGAGIAMGGAIRDIALHITESYSLAYASLFIGEAVGLYFCIVLLMRVDVKGYAKQRLMRSSSTELGTTPPQQT